MFKKNDSFFDEMQKKTKVNPQDLFQLASTVGKANLKDEKTLRQLVHRVAELANQPVTQEKEDKIVKAILNNDMPADFASLGKMFNSKK